MLDMMQGGYYYLASPYSGYSKHQERRRYTEVMRYAADLLRQDILVFSPIVHFHRMGQVYDLPTDAASWQRHNEIFMRQSIGVIVACMQGWKLSKGVKHEIEYARSRAMPIYKAISEHGLIYVSKF